MCYRCFKPVQACVCADVTPVDNQTGVIILQHPRERNHPFGTERFARLGLRQIEVRECGPKDPEAMARASVLPPKTALVYPSPGAREVSSLTVDERPKHIVLVDATWHQAKTIVRAAPWLMELPRIRLQPTAPGEYRIRREPRPNYLSTIEATVGVLRALEPDTEGLEDLLTAFRRMVDHQVRRSSRAPARRIQAPRRDHKPLPPAFTTGYPRLVLVYGEVITTRVGEATVAELVYWCAVRPATGDVFARFIRPPQSALSREHLAHMGLTEAQILGGGTPKSFLGEWADFCGPNAVLAAWSRHSLNAVPSSPESLLLKGIACNLSGGACGHLREYLSRLGLIPEDTSFQGRARQHMGHVLAVAKYLRRTGLGEITSP